MKAIDFVNAVIAKEYQQFVALLSFHEVERIHTVIALDEEMPKDDDNHTLMFRFDEVPGATPQAIIKAVVSPKYRKNAVILLNTVKKDTIVTMKPNDPIPDDRELGRDYEVFLRLEKLTPSA